MESFCKGICFSARPVSVGELVLIKCTDVSPVHDVCSNHENYVWGNYLSYLFVDHTYEVGLVVTTIELFLIASVFSLFFHFF